MKQLDSIQITPKKPVIKKTARTLSNPKPKTVKEQPVPQSERPSFFGFAFELVKILFLALLIIIPLRYYLVQPFFVNGSSMKPSFSSGDYLIINEIGYRFHEPKRGEVVIFRPPDGQKTFYIKRLIGLPGEKVEIKGGQVFINENKISEEIYLSEDEETDGNTELELKNNEYFVLGDNRDGSSDSRQWGTITREEIIGKVWLRVFPFSESGVFELPNYN